MPRKKKKEKVEEALKDWTPKGETEEEAPWSWEPEETEEESVEEEELPFSEEPKSLYPVQMKFGLGDWQDTVTTVELLGSKAVEIDNYIAAPTATVRGGWRFFESNGATFKLRESDWQRLIA